MTIFCLPKRKGQKENGSPGFFATRKKPEGFEDHFHDIKYISNFDYIINVEIRENAGIFQETESWQRVGDLVFEKINNEWKLTIVYFPYRD